MRDFIAPSNWFFLFHAQFFSCCTCLEFKTSFGMCSRILSNSFELLATPWSRQSVCHWAAAIDENKLYIFLSTIQARAFMVVFILMILCFQRSVVDKKLDMYQKLSQKKSKKEEKNENSIISDKNVQCPMLKPLIISICASPSIAVLALRIGINFL